MHRTAAAPRIHISADDDHMTGLAGPLLSGELIRWTRLVARIDGAVEGSGLSGAAARSERRRAVGVAGRGDDRRGNHLAHLEVLRQDAAGAGLRAVAETPAPTTVGQLLRRSTVDQLRTALAPTAEGQPSRRRTGARCHRAGDAGNRRRHAEVYGRQKEGPAFTRAGSATSPSG